MIKSIFSILVMMGIAAPFTLAQIQIRIPRVSQGAKVSQTIGLSEISISYSRPGVKGRVIWGNVVKYGEVWRAGANEPTLVTFSDDAVIDGKKIGAGTYRFVVIPAESGAWTLIFNTETKNWGTVYEAKYDSVKLSCTPETGPNEEWLSYGFTDLTPASARFVLAWEKIRLGFKVEFNTLAKMQGSVTSWQSLAGAARFALDNNIYLDEGLKWADQSIALDKNGRNLQTKAELLAKLGRLDEAILTGGEALRIIKAKDPNANVGGLEKLIAGWKSKK